MQLLLKTTVTFIIFLLGCYLSAQQNPYIEHYDNGKTKASGFKTDAGTLIGKWTYYRKDGSVDAEITYNAQGSPQGPFAMYYRNGQLQTKSSYSGEGFYEMHGPYEDYHKNGQLQSIGSYKKNKTIGKWTSYWENGQIKALTFYTKKGVIQKNTEYFKNGQLRLDALYNDIGDLTGTFALYYDTGQLRTQQEFDADGNKIGTYTSYYPNGKLMEIGDYAGVDYFRKKGEWKTYYKSGQLKTKITYDNQGKRVGDILKFEEE